MDRVPAASADCAGRPRTSHAIAQQPPGVAVRTSKTAPELLPATCHEIDVHRQHDAALKRFTFHGDVVKIMATPLLNDENGSIHVL